MKTIKLPIIDSVRITLPDPSVGGSVHPLENGRFAIANGPNIYIESTSDELNIARDNGGKIIWSTTCIENLLERIIGLYVFENPVFETAKSEFFYHEILQTSFFSYSSKKNLVIKIVETESLVVGQHKDELSSKLRKVMDYRNAFAHGSLTYESNSGCYLNYYCSGKQKKLLDNLYWETLEGHFKFTFDQLDNILHKLRLKLEK